MTISNRLVLGGAFGERPDAESFALLARFKAAGGRWVETAASYAGGEGERQIARWLKITENSDSDGIYVISKIGHGLTGSDANLSAEGLRVELQNSLERLEQERIDMLLLHRDEPTRPVDEVVATLAGFQAAGYIGQFGVSNFTLDRVFALEHAARTQGLPGPQVVSMQFSLAVPRADKLWPGSIAGDAGDVAEVTARGMRFLAWSSQARGFFANPPGSAAGDLGTVFDTLENHARAARAAELGRWLGISASGVSLSAVLSLSADVMASIGPATEGELADSLRAAEIKLSDSDRRWLAEPGP